MVLNKSFSQKDGNVKIVAIVGLAILIVGLFGLRYFILEKIKPEEIRKISLVKIKEVFPNAEVEIGKIELDLGLKINLNVEKLKIYLKNKNTNLVDLGNFSIRIPILSILTGSGSIEIHMGKPKIGFIDIAGKNNWELAMDGAKKNAPSESNEKKSNGELAPSEVAIPAIVSKIKINFFVTDLLLNYKTKESTGDFIISKLSIKNFNLMGPAAYEIKSNIKYNIDEKSKISLNLLAIGEVNLSDYIEKKILTNNVEIKLDDISSSSFAGAIPGIDAKVRTVLDGDKISGNVVTRIGEKSSVSMDYEVVKRDISISKINGSLALGDLAQNFLDELKTVKLEMSKTVLAFNGSFSMNEKGIDPNISFSMDPGFSFSANDINGSIGASGEYRKSNFGLKGEVNLMNGKGQLAIKGKLDPNEKNFKLEKMDPLDIKILLSDATFTEKMIKTLIYGEEGDKKSEKKEADTSVASNEKPKEKPMPLVVLPASRISLEIKNIKIGEELFEGKGAFQSDSSRFITKELVFGFSKGKGTLKHVSSFSKNRIDNTMDFKMDHLNLKGFRPFLPNNLKNIHGIFNGSIKGTASLSGEKITYNMDADLLALNGKLEGLNLSEKIKGLVEKIPMLKDKVGAKNYDVDGDFQELKFMGTFKDTIYDLKSFKFIGVNNKVEMTGQGSVYPLPHQNEGQVDVKFYDKTGKLSEILSANAGLNYLPMRLKGKNFDLMPDYNYTLAEVSKGAMKKQTGAVKEKVKDKLKDQMNKLLNGQGGSDSKKEGVKKLFKGLFGK